MKKRNRWFVGSLLATSAIAAVAAAACGGKQASQLVLVVQSDMQIPKDVTHVKLEVLAFGAVQFSSLYDVGVGVKIPATLGILPGRDITAPVTIRVVALQAGKARTLREVVTTIPINRTAQLRIPIQWACTGSAKESGNQVVSTCSPGLSCLDGVCVKNELASSELADFLEEEVFGGATAANASQGKCFDVSECFRGAVEVLPDEECTIPNGGLDYSVANVAIAPAPGPTGQRDGICSKTDADRCLIAIDGDLPGGWASPTAANTLGRIAIPKGYCNRAKAEGTRPRFYLSGACIAKRQAMVPCGDWSATGVAIPRNPDAPGEQGADENAGYIRCTLTENKCPTRDDAGVSKVCCLATSGSQPFTCTTADACRSDGGTTAPVARACDGKADCPGAQLCCENWRGSSCKDSCAPDEGEPCSTLAPACSPGKSCQRCAYDTQPVPPWASSICTATCADVGGRSLGDGGS